MSTPDTAAPSDDLETFEKISGIPCSAAELDTWHRKRGAFSRLSPPWEKFEIVAESPIENGRKSTIRVKTGPLWQEWVAEYRNVKEGEEFTDVQIAGPFAEWHHRHRYLAKGKGEGASAACSLVDNIRYKLPLGPVGKLFGGWFVRRKLERTFRYRHDLTKADITRANQHPPAEPMRILISGASGLVGRALVPYLEMQGHTVLRLTRNPEIQKDIGWDPDAKKLDLAPAGRIDAVIHLAGENVAGGRWSKMRKDRIFYSRKDGTRLLADSLAEMVDRPKVFISASGINYYEQDALNTHDESSPVGTKFLSEVCRAWEEGTRPAEDAGIRVCKLRIGMVLTPAGGALGKMLPAFKFGAGGRLSSGRQRVSWIAMDDLVDMIARALGDARWTGPVNAVAAEPATNREFTRAMAKAVRRPAIFPVPKFALKLLFGEMASETLLADLPIYSSRLEKELDYQLRHPDLEGALAHLLGAHPKDESRPAIVPQQTASPPVTTPDDPISS